MEERRRSFIKDLLKSTEVDRDINAKGWVRTKRGNKQIAFVALNDGSTINNIQVVIDIANFDETLKKGTYARVFTRNSPPEIPNQYIWCCLQNQTCYGFCHS